MQQICHKILQHIHYNIMQHISKYLMRHSLYHNIMQHMHSCSLQYRPIRVQNIVGPEVYATKHRYDYRTKELLGLR